MLPFIGYLVFALVGSFGAPLLGILICAAFLPVIALTTPMLQRLRTSDRFFHAYQGISAGIGVGATYFLIALATRTLFGSDLRWLWALGIAMMLAAARVAWNARWAIPTGIAVFSALIAWWIVR